MVFIITATVLGRTRRLGSVKALSATDAQEKVINAAYSGVYDYDITNIVAHRARRVGA
jgi:hypothetical protein